MPTAQSPTTRARDLDRSTLCAVLDTAYAEGQLDKAEHGARTTAAMAAKTLGQLRALADDLQVENALPPLRTPRPAREPPRRRRITTGLVATLVLAGETLAVTDPTSLYLIVGQDGESPNVRVHASNEFNESGYVQAGLDGTVMAVHPYEAG